MQLIKIVENCYFYKKFIQKLLVKIRQKNRLIQDKFTTRKKYIKKVKKVIDSKIIKVILYSSVQSRAWTLLQSNIKHDTDL